VNAQRVSRDPRANAAAPAAPAGCSARVSSGHVTMRVDSVSASADAGRIIQQVTGLAQRGAAAAELETTKVVRRRKRLRVSRAERLRLAPQARVSVKRAAAGLPPVARSRAARDHHEPYAFRGSFPGTSPASRTRYGTRTWPWAVSAGWKPGHPRAAPSARPSAAARANMLECALAARLQVRRHRQALPREAREGVAAPPAWASSAAMDFACPMLRRSAASSTRSGRGTAPRAAPSGRACAARRTAASGGQLAARGLEQPRIGHACPGTPSRTRGSRGSGRDGPPAGRSARCAPRRGHASGRAGRAANRARS